MCTLVTLHRCTPDAFLWVAANRDEFLDRPADGLDVPAGAFDRVAGGQHERARSHRDDQQLLH